MDLLELYVVTHMEPGLSGSILFADRLGAVHESKRI